MSEVKVGSMRLTDAELQAAMKRKAEGANYIGAGDNILDFGKGSSFIDEANTGKMFGLMLKNTGANDILVAICPGFRNEAAKIKTSAGNAVDAIITDGTVTVGSGGDAKTLVITGTPREVGVLLGYVKNNPTRISALSVKVSDPGQLDEPFILRTETPWEVAREVQVIPSNYLNQSDSNQTLAKIEDLSDWKLSDMDFLIYRVRAGKTVNLTFTFGASHDLAKGLNKKAGDAKMNVASAYLSRTK
jgi:hypothetical protein